MNQYLKWGALGITIFALGVLIAPLKKHLSSAPGQLLPAEYVYLDVSRVDAYLGQLDNGLSKSEKQALSKSRAGNAGVNLGQAISAGVSGTSGESSERTVTPSEGDRFYQLLKQLKTTFENEPHELDMNKLEGVTHDARQIPAGDFIEIRHAKLLIPPFALAVPKLSFGDQATVKGAKPVSRQAIARLIAHHPTEVKAYLKRFGSDPRFLLAIKGQAVNDERPLTVLIPIRYGDLVDTVSLVGDSLTVVGKVIVQPKEQGQQGEVSQPKPAYYDDEAAIAYKSALLHVPTDINKVLELPSNPTKLVKESISAEEPVMVILPVGIYS
jgi:hypothetical protein